MDKGLRIWLSDGWDSNVTLSSSGDIIQLFECFFFLISKAEIGIIGTRFWYYEDSWGKYIKVLVWDMLYTRWKCIHPVFMAVKETGLGSGKLQATVEARISLTC